MLKVNPMGLHYFSGLGSVLLEDRNKTGREDGSSSMSSLPRGPALGTPRPLLEATWGGQVLKTTGWLVMENRPKAKSSYTWPSALSAAILSHQGGLKGGGGCGVSLRSLSEIQPSKDLI